MPLEIRRATTADAELISRLGARIFIETFAPHNTPENMRRYVADAFAPLRVRAELADPKTTALIVEIDAAAAGYARLHINEAPSAVRGAAPIEMVRLYVDGAHHGTGAGAALMEAAIEAGRGLSRDVMWLGVWEHNPRAQAFYAKWGFVRVGGHAFMLGDDRQTDWLMERRL